MTPQERHSLLIAHGIIDRLLKNDPEQKLLMQREEVSLHKIQHIQKVVCAFYDVRYETLITTLWTKKVNMARKMSLLLIRDLLPQVQFNMIVGYTAYQNVASLRHALKKARQELKNNTIMQSDFRILKESLVDDIKGASCK